MSSRLEKALKILPPDEVNAVTEFAEKLAAKRAQSKAPQYLDLTWAGAAKGLRPSYTSGVDMAHEALRLRGQSS